MKWKSLIFSASTTKDKTSVTKRIFQTRCFFGMVADWPIMSEYWAKDWELHLHKHRWTVICSEKVYILLICHRNLQIIAIQVKRTQPDFCCCAKWLWESGIRSLSQIRTQLTSLLDSCQRRELAEQLQTLQIKYNSKVWRYQWGQANNLTLLEGISNTTSSSCTISHR